MDGVTFLACGSQSFFIHLSIRSQNECFYGLTKKIIIVTKHAWETYYFVTTVFFVEFQTLSKLRHPRICFSWMQQLSEVKKKVCHTYIFNKVQRFFHLMFMFKTFPFIYLSTEKTKVFMVSYSWMLSITSQKVLLSNILYLFIHLHKKQKFLRFWKLKWQ